VSKAAKNMAFGTAMEFPENDGLWEDFFFVVLGLV
jgi:hypothetical protein